METEWRKDNIDGDVILFCCRVKGTTVGSVHSTQASSHSTVKTLANALCCLSLKHHGQVGVPIFGFRGSHDDLIGQRTSRNWSALI